MARKQAPEVNAGSMADIAFLLLIFFLVTTTMAVDTGMMRRLPEPTPPNMPDPPPVKERNLFEVLINSNDQLLVEGEEMDITMLKKATKEFIMNKSRDIKKPEMKVREIEPFGNMEVSEAVISLQNDRGTTYSRYMAVQNELVGAYNELRDEFCNRRFGKTYAAVEQEDADLAKAVAKVIPQRISEAEPKTYKK